MAGRRLFIASVLAAAALLAVPAIANDRACTRDTIGRLPAQATALQLTLDEIFDRVPSVSIETPDGVTGEPETMEVVMVRIKDGKPVLACVDSKEAAVRFLTAPVEKIGTTKIAEEK